MDIMTTTLNCVIFQTENVSNMFSSITWKSYLHVESRSPCKSRSILLTFTQAHGEQFSGWELRIRNLNSKRPVSLDGVPKCRTKRCSPRFQPVDRFCEPKRNVTVPSEWGRELSAPTRPYVTYPFHPLDSTHDKQQYMQNSVRVS